MRYKWEDQRFLQLRLAETQRELTESQAATLAFQAELATLQGELKHARERAEEAEVTPARSLPRLDPGSWSQAALAQNQVNRATARWVWVSASVCVADEYAQAVEALSCPSSPLPNPFTLLARRAQARERADAVGRASQVHEMVLEKERLLAHEGHLVAIGLPPSPTRVNPLYPSELGEHHIRLKMAMEAQGAALAREGARLQAEYGEELSPEEIATREVPGHHLASTCPATPR
jgi:hypothetical protein